ncbi:acyl-CoA thioesterase [Paenibacillus koleovorans]|uniref:acyl-CoA thioesterase n=1 Tax=Paenibacillus koleovorans TaxID=121608 RepID=UPI000FD84918|nr:acyl-CoA thioesterase [Paenibacillus koleovorans]
MEQRQRYCKESRCYRTFRVFPTDVNNHNTLFGGKLMASMDDIASIAAAKHCRCFVVTASTDSVDFLLPILTTESVTMESFVTWTGRSSMEVFVKVITEDLRSGVRKIAATSFLTFVALDESKMTPIPVPLVVPETEEEKRLHETGEKRAEIRKLRREESKKFAGYLTDTYSWE